MIPQFPVFRKFKKEKQFNTKYMVAIYRLNIKYIFQIIFYHLLLLFFYFNINLNE